MPTKQQLEAALRNADAAGDVEAARALANALKAGQYDSEPTQAAEPGAEIPAWLTRGRGRFSRRPERPEFEFMDAVNEAAASVADFALTPLSAPFDIAADLSGSDSRFPKLRTAVEEATPGSYMQPGLARDVVRGAGEVIPGAVAGGGIVRGLAEKLPAQTAAVESLLPALLRQAGKTSVGADVALGGVSGAGMVLGGEAGEAVGGDTGRQVGEMLGALAAPVAASAVASPFIKVPLRPVGVLADENGLTQTGVTAVERRQMTSQQAAQAVESAQQQARRAAFEKVGVEPTKAQLTRNADDFMQQQELGKHSGAIRTALENQDAVLTQRVDEIAQSTGGASREAYETGYAIEDAITKRVLFEDELATNLYQAANDAAGGQSKVLLKGFNKALDESMGADEVSGGVLKAIRSTLKQKGILLDQAKSGVTSTGMVEKHARLNPQQVEREVRQLINSYWDSTTPAGRRILTSLKDAVDEDVFRSAGDDFYREARGAFEKSRKSLEQVKKHKFYQNDRSVVKQILEGGMAPEDIFGKLVVGRGGKVDDLKLLKTYLNSGDGELGEAGKAAWNDLRAQTLVHLRERATKAFSLNEQEQRTFNGAEFKKAIDSIGMPKLKEILNPEELSALDDIAKVGVLRIPTPGSGNGEGPSAVAINALKENLGLIERTTLKLLEMGYKTKKARGVLDGQVIDMPALYTEEPRRSVAPLVGVLESAN